MEKTTILDDIGTLREFATRFPVTSTMSVPPSHIRELLTGTTKDLALAGAVLAAVGRVFAPSKKSETAKTVAPEVARAELAKLPVPRQLWDDVLEPLLAMAEGTADSRLDEALRKLRSATSRPDSVDACLAALRAVTSVQLLLDLTEGGSYEAAAQIAGDAFQALRAIRDDLRERDRPWCESVDDQTAWIRFVPRRVARNLGAMVELREVVKPKPQTDEQLVRRAKQAFKQLWRLVRDARLVADDSVDPNDADTWQPMVDVAIDAVRALMTLSQSYGMPDHASWMRVVEDCLRNRRAVPLLRAELEQRGWAKLIGGSRTEVEVLHEWARECPINFAEGQTPEIAAVLEAVESLFSVVPRPAAPPAGEYSQELDAYRRLGYRGAEIAWMEMIERRVALLVEHARTAPAVDDETPKPGPAVETGDAVEALRRLVEVIERGGGPTKLCPGVDLGQASWMVKLASAIDDAKAVLEHEVVDIAVTGWDRQSELICDALGPYYSDDGAGYDYDGMVLAIRALRAHSQALQELLSIHESDWPHDVAMKAATCVTLLSKSCNRWYCANGLMVAAGGSCPSCGPSRGPAAVAQQTPDPAQGA